MLKDRLSQYQQLERERKTKVIAYVTGDRPGWETQIHSEVLDHFIHHLDAIGVVDRISLYLYTRGGDTLASWSIANLLRQFCKELEVIVPSKAQSGGTLICLGADRIVMTKQATMGPIDPSVNGPLNPQVPGNNARVPVSVEAINGYIEFVRDAMNGDEAGMASILNQLASQVHPLVLGNAYRGRAQIRMLARRLVVRHVNKEEEIEKILGFLCSESGSHDYTIFRREARDELKLKVEKPDDNGYKLIKSIYDDIAEELELTRPFDANVLFAQGQPSQQPPSPGPQPSPQPPKAHYSLRRGLVESVAGGCHVHVSEGTYTKLQVPAPIPGLQQDALRDDRTFEGWRHEP